MHQINLHFTSEYTIILGFWINIISNIESMSFSLWQYFHGKTIPKVRSVHNTYTSTRSLQFRPIKINHKNSMCNSLHNDNPIISVDFFMHVNEYEIFVKKHLEYWSIGQHASHHLFGHARMCIYITKIEASIWEDLGSSLGLKR